MQTDDHFPHHYNNIKSKERASWRPNQTWTGKVTCCLYIFLLNLSTSGRLCCASKIDLMAEGVSQPSEQNCGADQTLLRLWNLLVPISSSHWVIFCDSRVVSLKCTSLTDRDLQVTFSREFPTRPVIKKVHKLSFNQCKPAKQFANIIEANKSMKGEGHDTTSQKNTAAHLRHGWSQHSLWLI